MADKEKMQKGTKEKISELQMLQQRLTMYGAQKQQFQIQMAEIENALEQVGKTKGAVYQQVGEILVEKNHDELKKELGEKKEENELRIKTIEKQENKIKESALALQKEIQGELK
ncbi:MAG: prefoldin subunit beta [Nanoarchaeota archaeon]